MIDLSIVIPCYNEASRNNLLHRLNTLYNYMRYDTDIRFELIFVNDGSTDDTYATLNEFVQNNDGNVQISIISYDKNVGKGYALKQGIEKAEGVYTLMIDADLNIPLDNIQSFYKCICSDENPDLIVGNRINNYNTNITRKFLTKSARFCTTKIIGLKNSGDTQCGFKMFSTSKVQSILRYIKSDRWLLDIELILYMQTIDGQVKYIDVESKNNLPSTINNAEALITSMKELFYIMMYRNQTIHQIQERGDELWDDEITAEHSI